MFIDKLTEAIELLSMHYEIGYHDDCKEMERAQNAVRKAADAYEAVANKLDDNTKEAIEGLLQGIFFTDQSSIDLCVSSGRQAWDPVQ